MATYCARRWLNALRTRRAQTGRRPTLTDEQKERVLELLETGAEAQGAIGERWTGPRVAARSKREFSMSYHPEAIPRLLRSRGWAPQKPGTQARQRDATKIAPLKADWGAIKRGRSASDEPLSGETSLACMCCPLRDGPAGRGAAWRVTKVTPTTDT